MVKKKIQVMVIDDSAVVRQAMNEIFSSDPEIEVMAMAPDPLIAAQKMEKAVPDVITLDVEMPRMDGITFLKKLMSQHPIPVVICSTLTEKGSETTLKAFEYGAVEIITKPKLGTKLFLEESRIRICDAVKAAAKVRVKKIPATPTLKRQKKRRPMSPQVKRASPKPRKASSRNGHAEGIRSERQADRRHR